MTIVEPPPTLEPAPDDKESPPVVAGPTPRRTGLKLLIIAVVWGVGYLFFKNVDTLTRPFVQLNSFDTGLNHIRDNIQASTQTNWFFHGIIGNGSDWVNARFTQLQNLLSQPCCGRPVPKIGWLGVVAIFGWLALALAGFRASLMVIAGTLLFGILGYWQDSVDTVLMVLLAVIVSIIIGVPIGIAMARRRWVSRAITPVLDVMQTMPSFAYIPFFAVIFGIGLTCAIMLTIVYAIPPLVRITEHGLRTVSETTVEAAGSMGLTRGQLLRKVQVPMARRTIIVGVNQCTLAALSMVVLTAFVDGPGLGKDVLTGLTNLNVGEAAVPGLIIVIIAIVLDRTTTLASERRERTQGRIASVSGPGVMLTSVVLERLPRWASEETRTRRLPSPMLRRILLGVTLVVALVCVWLSQTYLDLAQFPDSLNVGPHLVDAINSFTNWVVGHAETYTEDIRNFVTYGFLNPLQALLANTPWWLMAPVLMAFSYVIGGLKPLLTTTVCSAIILLVGLWHDAMVTLTVTLVATVLVMILAIVLGVWIGRSRGRTRSSGRSSTRSRRSRLRVPDPGAGAVRTYAVHRHRRRGALRVPDLGEAGRRRHPRGVRHDRGGGPGQWHHSLADDPQGPDADGAVRDRARDQPGTALRPVDGGHRRPGRRRCSRLPRGLGLLAGQPVRQGARRGHLARRSRHHARPHRPRCGRPWAHLMVRLTSTTTRHPAGSAKEEGRMARRRLRLPGLMSVAAAIALALSACGGGNISTNAKAAASNCGNLNIAMNAWTGYYADAYVVGEIAKNKLGCNVKYVNLAEQPSWNAMANGTVDTILENWGHDDLVKKYITQQKVVEDAGLTGNEGVIGWYVPPWMAQKYPDITNWKNLNKYASMFKTSESGGKGQLLDGDPSYVTNDQALVKNLHLNYQVVVGGSEAALIQSFRTREKNKTPLLAYFYEPQWFFSEMKLVKVQPAEVHAGLRRRPGEGRVRLPAVPPEQADLDQVRRLGLAGGRR